MNDSKSSVVADENAQSGQLSPGQIKVINLIAGYQLAHKADISGKRLRVALEDLGLDDAEMAALMDVFVRPTERIPPNDRYKLALWGWVASEHAPRVEALLGAVLTLLRDKFNKDPDFTHFSWLELRESFPSRDDADDYFVREALEAARISNGEDGFGWRAPWDIEKVRKLKGPREFLEYRARSEDESRASAERAQRRLDTGFDPFDESNDALIEELSRYQDPTDEDPGQEPAQTSTASSQDVLHPEEPSIDFAILTAIEVERRAVCDAFGLTHEHRIRRGARVYWRGRLPLETGEAYELVVAQAPDAANVDAAILTNDLLHHWQPGAALLVGVAASSDLSKARLGDVVIGSDVYYYERGKETSVGLQPEPRMLPADSTLWSNVTAVRDWDGKISTERPDRSETPSRVHQGIIASVEKVIAETAVRDQIVARHRKILAIEMEGYGFSRAVWQSFEKVRHLDIRGICDDGSPAKDDRWHFYAAAAAAGFAKHFLLDRPLDPLNGASPLTSSLRSIAAQWPRWAWLLDRLRSSGLEPMSTIELPAIDARSSWVMRSSWVILTQPSEQLQQHFELASQVLVFCAPGDVIQENDIKRVEKIFSEDLLLDPGFALVITADPDAEKHLASILPDNRRYLFVRGEAYRTARDAQVFLRGFLRDELGPRRLFDFRLPAGERQFFGREKELETLQRDVLTGHSLGVFGLRKVGKTSLLERMAEKLREGRPGLQRGIPIKVDLQATSYLRRNFDGVCELIGTALDRELSRAQISIPASPPHPLERLRVAVEHIDQTLRARVVVILDEYEVLLDARRIPKRDGVELLTWLRGLAQNHPKGFSFVLAGRNQRLLAPARIDDADNPMYRFLRSVPVAGLAPDDCQRMVQALGGRMGLHFERDALDLLVHETGGHPALVRTLGDLIDVHVSTSERNPAIVDAALVKRVLPRFSRDVEEDMREFVNAANDFDARAGDYLVHLAHGVPWIGGPSEARIDDALIGYGILHPDTHEFRVGRLRTWLRENHQSPAEAAHG